MVLSSAPYTTTTSFQRERFLRAFTKEWDFSKLSEFFMYLQSPANIDYKVKCVMLQEAARRERETLGAKLRKKRVVVEVPSEMIVQEEANIVQEDGSTRRHHRRTSSNDVNDIKRLRLSTPDLDQTENEGDASSSRHHHPLRTNTINELSHLHLNNVESSSSNTETRTRSSSIESCDDPMETDTNINKKRGITTHFTEE